MESQPTLSVSMTKYRHLLKKDLKSHLTSFALASNKCHSFEKNFISESILFAPTNIYSYLKEKLKNQPVFIISTSFYIDFDITNDILLSIKFPKIGYFQ